MNTNENYSFSPSLCQVFVGTFFVFRNSVEKLCVSWALPFNKHVRVWACKIRKPHTHVFVPTSHKVFLRNYGSRIKGHQTPGANYLFYPPPLLTIPLISIHKQFTNYIKFEHRFDTFDFYTKAMSWNKEQLQLIWQMPISHFWYFFIKLLFQKGGWVTSRPFPFVKLLQQI